MCSRKGALYIPVPEISALRITAGESELTAYKFNTQTATHYFCKHCGVHPFHRPRVAPDRWSVNARCLHDFDIASLARSTYDGKNWEATAKAQGWIK